MKKIFKLQLTVENEVILNDVELNHKSSSSYSPPIYSYFRI